jgi:hypothetical protein
MDLVTRKPTEIPATSDITSPAAADAYTRKEGKAVAGNIPAAATI